MVHAYRYADYGGDDGLNVIIYSDNGRAEILLTYHHTDICYICGAYHHSCYSEPFVEAYCLPFGGGYDG